MDERRAGDRRSGGGGYTGPERRSGSRRAAERGRNRSVAWAPPVRRVFPIGEGRTMPEVRRREQAQRLSLAAADVVAVVLAVQLARIPFSLTAVAVCCVAALVAAELLGLYDKDDVVIRRSTLDEVPSLAELALVVVGVHALFFTGGLGALSFFVLAAVLLFVLTVVRSFARLMVRRSLPPERCLVIGDTTVADQIRRKIAVSRACASVVANVPLQPGQTASAFGGVDGLRKVLEAERVERVILAPVSTDASDTLELVRIAKQAGVRVSMLPRLFEVVGSSVEFEDIDGMQMLAIRRFGLSRSAIILKRAFDMVGALAALVVALPALLAIALLIRLTSPGPVFFRQTRVGRDGRHFRIFKFRTMVVDAESRKDELRAHNQAGDGLFKIENDPRITGIGNFLRKSSLDELPQLFNVIKGDMSLVGPRPLVVDEDAKVLGLDRQRLHLTPGMTGPWQVLGSARVPMREMVGIDYLYVANWSLWNDLKLLLRTASYVLGRGGM